MLRCLNSSENLAESCSDMTLLERQRDRMKWQLTQFHHHHPNQCFFSGSGFDGGFSSLQVPNPGGMMMVMNNGGGGSGLGDGASNAGSVNPGSVRENGWPELGKVDLPGVGFVSSGFNAGSTISRTSSCPPSVAAAAAAEATPTEKMRSTSGRESFKKRKSEKAQIPKVVVAENEKNKKSKTSGEEFGESKVTTTDNNHINNDKNRETSAESSKENSKASEVQNQKPDYIHVRARRGQATDSHSIAERARREKISERMKYLQSLVPGCNKITGKAGMLDEIINYVQSLQQQVEFLSMKLAAVNPTIDFNIDDLFTKEVFPACAPTSFPAIDMTLTPNPAAYLQQFDPTHVASCSGLDMGIINPPDLGLRRTISAPLSLPHETFLDSSCFNQIMPFSTVEGDIQNLYNVTFDQARSTTSSFPSQPFTGLIEASNLKMEM